MCLETVIGLSQTECNCVEDLPTDYNESDSGIYLDELEGLSLKLADSAADCGRGSLWDILQTARTNAIFTFKGDLLVQIGSQYKKTLESNTYAIGSQKYTTAYNPNTVYAGLRIVPRQIVNGKIKINTVSLIFNTTIVVQCHIFNNLSDTALQSFTVSCTANRVSSSSALNYELPMYVSGDEVEYFLVYELPVTARPLQNKIVCSSCLHWDIKCCQTACFGNRTAKDQLWNNNLMIGGISGDTWDDLDNQTGISNQNNGVIINLTLNCDYEDIVCSNLDFTNGGLPMAIATAVQLRAGAMVCDAVLSSGNINRYIMLDRERIQAKRIEYLSEYGKRVTWLSQNIDVSENGCYQCEQRMVKSGIYI